MGSNQSTIKCISKYHISDITEDVIDNFGIPNGVTKKYNKIPKMNKENNNIRVDNWRNYFQKKGVEINLLYITDEHYVYTHRISVRQICIKFVNNIDSKTINDFLCSLRDFNITGSLHLSGNKLVTLPESFTQVKIGEDLLLYNNKLKSLSENFDNIKIGGTLNLGGNKLSKLPKNFGKIKIGKDLLLGMNPLKNLPKNFGNIEIGGDLFLSCTKLRYLPKNFGYIKMNGDLSLTNTDFINFPKSFKHLENIKCLFLDKDKFIDPKSLPLVKIVLIP
jgi:hypothetical protein